MKPKMRITLLQKIISLILLANSFDVFAQNLPCEGKYWIDSPILKKDSQEESGIGGTGFYEQDKSVLSHLKQGEEGIGGTGIVGVIAGFGSICVNGLEVHYNEMTPIFEDGQTSSKQRLGLGQTVSILAMPNSQDYYAKEIHVLHEVQGKIEAINAADGIFNVLGQTVHFPETLLEELSVGDTIAISGNRLIDGSIEALRVEQLLATEKVTLIGTLETDAANRFYIGKQQLSLPANQTELHVGNEISVQGVLQNSVLQVENLRQNPRWNFSEKVEQIFMQGYVRQSNTTEINIDGVHIAPNDKIEKMPKVGERTSAWVKIFNERQPTLEHWHSAPVLPERIPNNSAIHELQEPNRHENPRNFEMNHSRPEIRDFGFEKNMPSRPEIQHVDIDKPTLLRLNARPDIEKPTVLKPEHIEIEKPLITRPEIEHLGTEKPNVPRPEVHGPDLPYRK